MEEDSLKVSRERKKLGAENIPRNVLQVKGHNSGPGGGAGRARAEGCCSLDWTHGGEINAARSTSTGPLETTTDWKRVCSSKDVLQWF